MNLSTFVRFVVTQVGRVNIKDKESGYLIGCNVRRTTNQNYYVNLRTIYKEREKSPKETGAVEIFI